MCQHLHRFKPWLRERRESWLRNGQIKYSDYISAQLVKLHELVDRSDPVLLAFNIECTKVPLKFPDADLGDQVMRIRGWRVAKVL